MSARHPPTGWLAVVDPRRRNRWLVVRAPAASAAPADHGTWTRLVDVAARGTPGWSLAAVRRKP